MIDGSRRVTQRNRKFLRRIPSDQRKLDYGMVPTMPPIYASELPTNVVSQSAQLPDQISQAAHIQPDDTRVREHVAKPQVLERVREEPITTPTADTVSTAAQPDPVQPENQVLRRSTRVKSNPRG